jgi:hypothetical protein
MGNSRLHAARGPSPCERAQQISRLGGSSSERVSLRARNESIEGGDRASTSLSAAPRSARPRRRAVHPQRRAPSPVEFAGRPLPGHPRRQLPSAAGPEAVVLLGHVPCGPKSAPQICRAGSVFSPVRYCRWRSCICSSASPVVISLRGRCIANGRSKSVVAALTMAK